MEEIVVKSFATEQEAELAKNLLQTYGVNSFVQGRGVHSSGIPSDRYGADLFVLEKDAESAKELLESPLDIVDLNEPPSNIDRNLD